MDDLAHARNLVDLADLLRPAAVRAAATLGLADHIAAGTGDPGELAGLCGARPDQFESLLDYLAALGLLRRDASGDVELTAAGQPLRGDHPASVREFLRLDGMFGRSDTALLGLVHTLRTGEPAHVGMYGEGYWESLDTRPELTGALARVTADHLVFDGELVVDAYDWSGVRSVVDVGGNTGALLVNLLRGHGHLSGTLVDLPGTARIARDHFASRGLADRATAVGGSFFEELPAGHDVYLLSAVLADWDDERATAILRRCAEAAGTGGKVLVAEVSLRPDPADPEAARSGLWVRAMMPHPVRTVAELKELGRAAGLEATWEGPATPVRSLIEFTAMRNH